MSFMFNPYPYDDPKAVNRPVLPNDVINAVVSGTKESAMAIADSLIEKFEKNTRTNIILAVDGYISAQFESLINLIAQNLLAKSIDVKKVDFSQIFKSKTELDQQFAEYLDEDLIKDPIQLFGKLFHGGYEEMVDSVKLDQFYKQIEAGKVLLANQRSVTIVFGQGCTISSMRPLYDAIAYFDVTPKEVILRARAGAFANLGDDYARPIRPLLRRCYYVDFEVALKLRWELLKADAIDFYIASDSPANFKLLRREAFNEVLKSLVKYPLRCKPVYLEGVWGGHYIKKVRNLPDAMRNCAWVFDLIPLEVSIVVQSGKNLLEFPFFTFVQKEGLALLGSECIEKFGGYFPIRFNYDDSYHSSGNMSIQVHSGESYNKEHYNELGRQDESYYIVEAAKDAKTFIGFEDAADPDEFIAEIKKSELTHSPVDYEKYVSHVKSVPGMQVLLPAGTIHSSGRNQLVLEIGSLTVGSYTYKLYDYLRADLDGLPRPIHTWHGERTLEKERNLSWVKDNLVPEPKIIRSGHDWAESIIGEHDLIYFSLRKLEFQHEIEGETNGVFHVLTLVDGEKIQVESIDNPKLSYTQHYLDVIVIPANFGKYRLKNLGVEPICVHKTMLKDGFINDGISHN